MKKTFLLMAFVVTTVSLYAQEQAPQVPPPKNIVPTKLAKLPQQPIKLPGGKPIDLPPRPDPVIASLTIHTWHLIRWWTTGNIGHSSDDVSFKFLANGVISCNMWVADANQRLESGTYSVNGNNVTITLKKDANIIMTCNCVYNSSSKILTGTYSLQVLPITNPPVGYTPGTVTGDVKLEIKP